MSVALVAVAVGLLVRGIPRVPDVDSVSYRLMAAGRMNEVVRPYANRILHPLVVRGVGEVLKCGSSKVRECGRRDVLKCGSSEVQKSGTDSGSQNDFKTLALPNFRISLETLAFCVVAVTSLVIALAALADLMPQLSTVPFAVLVASPTLCLFSVNVYLHDLFALALTALLFWALAAKRLPLAFALLFLLQTTRESTVVIAAAVLAAGAYRRQWGWTLGTCVALAAGCAFVTAVSREALPNIHAMSGAVYLLAKVAANGAENLLGLTVWSDTYARQLPNFYPAPPVWQMAVPSWLPLGGMRVVGVYSVDFWRPLEVAVLLLSAFGVLPAVLCKRGVVLVTTSGGRLPVLGGGWRTHLSGIARFFGGQPPAVQVAVIVGAAFLLLSPFAGRTVERQIGYAWPLFWLTLAEAREAEVGGRRSDLNHTGFARSRFFWLVHGGCMWWPVLLARSGLPRGTTALLGLVGVAVCYIAAVRCVRRSA